MTVNLQLVYAQCDNRCLHLLLAASARRSAAHAAVATAVAHHDGPAHVATGRVAHVVHVAHGVGGVVDAAVLQAGPAHGACRRRLARPDFGRDPAARCHAVPAGCRHLAQPLGHFFGQAGNVLLRRGVRVFIGIALRQQARRGRQLRRLWRQPGEERQLLAG